MSRVNHGAKAMASSAYNRQAAGLLRSARLRARLTQAELAMLLTEVLGFEVSPESVSYMESATNTISAGVLLAAQALSGQPIRSARVNVRDLWRTIASRLSPK